MSDMRVLTQAALRLGTHVSLFDRPPALFALHARWNCDKEMLAASVQLEARIVPLRSGLRRAMVWPRVAYGPDS
jgi:hypothetical protein